jgi:hypothetical protein
MPRMAASLTGSRVRATSFSEFDITAECICELHLAWALALLGPDKDGPIVVETPPNILGFVDDFWFHYVIDMGNAGPARAASSYSCRQAIQGKSPKATSSPVHPYSAIGSGRADFSSMVTRSRRSRASRKHGAGIRWQQLPTLRRPSRMA